MRRAELRRHLRERLIALQEVIERLEPLLPRLQIPEIEGAAADPVRKIGVPERAEEPDSVLRDRAADRDVVLLHRLNGGETSGKLPPIRVVAVPGARLIVVGRSAFEDVAARRRD